MIITAAVYERHRRRIISGHAPRNDFRRAQGPGVSRVIKIDLISRS